MQKEVSQEKMRAYLGQTVEVLVEEQQKERWRGRNPQGKLVFFPDSRDLRGQLVQVAVKHTGPWSMSGEAIDRPRIPASAMAVPDIIPLGMPIKVTQ